MWGEKRREERRENDGLRARVAKLIDERDEARTERDDARANRKRIQDLYDNLLAESAAKPQETAPATPAPVTPAAATPEAADRETRRTGTAMGKLCNAEPAPEQAEVRRQLHTALSRSEALERRVAELQAANLRYARQAYDQAAAARRTEVSGADA